LNKNGVFWTKKWIKLSINGGIKIPPGRQDLGEFRFKPRWRGLWGSKRHWGGSKNDKKMAKNDKKRGIMTKNRENYAKKWCFLGQNMNKNAKKGGIMTKNRENR